MTTTPPAGLPDPREHEILSIIAQETGVEPTLLVRDATLEKLDIPSLDIAQTIFALEERFKIDIPVVTDRSGAEFSTVGELVDHVIHTLDHAQGQQAS